MKSLILALGLAFVASCCHSSKKSAVPQQASDLREPLLDKYIEKLKLAESMQDPKTGWLNGEDCDAMLWEGLFASALEVQGVRIDAAEYPNQLGRFNRRPTPFCEAGAGSQTSWSRDMGMGLIIYAWEQKDRDLLQRHANYGAGHQWKMGEPFADGRVLYTPNMIGNIYQVIHALGGGDNVLRQWPNVYPKGLTDYQAHLQMLDIWLRGDIDDDLPLTEINPDLGVGPTMAVSQTMYERIKEHSDREPRCPFYSYLRGLYDGSVAGAAQLLLDDTYECSYGRGNERAMLSDWLWLASQTLQALPVTIDDNE